MSFERDKNLKREGNFIFVFCFMFGIAFAQSDSLKSISFSGYLDCYYAYNFIEPVSKNVPFAYNHNRHNEFNVNQVLLALKFKKERVRANVAMHAGTYVKANYAAEPSILQLINEANVGVRLTKKLWLDAGIMPSHIGLETAISKDNWTLTRSLCAENSPYYETGAKLTFLPNEKWSMAALVLNGWQNIEEKNSNKAVGTQVQFLPNDKLTLNYSTFIGEGRNMSDSLQVLRHFHDLYFTYLISQKLSLAAVLDLGYEEKSIAEKQFISWYTPALFVRYKFNKKWATCFRAEYFDDQNKIIGINEEVAGFSLNFDFAPLDQALIRIEGKTFPVRDSQGHFDDSSFLNSTLTCSIAIGF
ncbi:MAG: porin [Bacteroidia bacterium]|nr:porin [Bacteroidia bacterium]